MHPQKWVPSKKLTPESSACLFRMSGFGLQCLPQPWKGPAQPHIAPSTSLLVSIITCWAKIRVSFCRLYREPCDGNPELVRYRFCLEDLIGFQANFVVDPWLTDRLGGSKAISSLVLCIGVTLRFAEYQTWLPVSLQGFLLTNAYWVRFLITTSEPS